MKLTGDNLDYIGGCVEGFLLGLYTGIFAVYWKIHTSKEETKKFNLKQNIIFYAVCLLYALSAGVFALDTAGSVMSLPDDMIVYYRMGAISVPVLFGCCDFIAQSILVYRCWIVWGRNIHVVTIPSILAFAYLVMWVTSISGQFIDPSGGINGPPWGNDLTLTSLALSMAVNALVTGLIVFRIFKVFRQVESHTNSDEKSLGVTRGGHLRSVIFIIIESGMALFAIQLARFAVAVLPQWTDTEQGVYDIIVVIHEMLNGITPTIILVRVSMRLSFHNEPSLEGTVSSLRFGPGNPICTMGSVGQESLDIAPGDPIPVLCIDQERRGEDDIAESDEIQMVDR